MALWWNVRPLTSLPYTRVWHLIDMKEQVLGRTAAKIAPILMGKGKPIFHPGNDCGDYVVVINAKYLRLTGRKEEQKVYRYHTGRPGGLREIPFKRMMKKDPRQVIKNAVSGMLPKNKLREPRLSRLLVFPGEEHPFEQNIVRRWDPVEGTYAKDVVPGVGAPIKKPIEAGASITYEEIIQRRDSMTWEEQKKASRVAARYSLFGDSSLPDDLRLPTKEEMEKGLEGESGWIKIYDDETPGSTLTDPRMLDLALKKRDRKKSVKGEGIVFPRRFKAAKAKDATAKPEWQPAPTLIKITPEAYEKIKQFQARASSSSSSSSSSSPSAAGAEISSGSKRSDRSSSSSSSSSSGKDAKKAGSESSQQ